GDTRDREIAQAALSAAGVDDSPLTDEEMAELKELRAKVAAVRDERVAREKLHGAGFGAGKGTSGDPATDAPAGTPANGGAVAEGTKIHADSVDGDIVRRPDNAGAGTEPGAAAGQNTHDNDATEGGR